MRNVNKYKQYMTFPDKTKFKSLVEASANIADTIEDYKNSNYSKMKDAEKKDLLGCLMVGPLTMSEFLKEMGVEDLMEKYDHAKLAYAVHDQVGLVYQLKRVETKWDMDKKLRQVTYVNPQEQYKTDNSLEQDPQYTLWDKFFDFLGYKTDHAKKVDLYNATMQSLKERKDELEYEANKAINKDKVDDLIERGKEGQAERVAKIKALNKTAKKWEKLFLGEQEKAPVYKFGSGKLKLSALSACMAMYTKKYGYGDLGALQADSKRLDSVLQNEDSMKKFREVGKEFMELYQSKENTLASKEREKFKGLDDFMFDKPRGNELTAEDKKMLSAIYDKEKNTEDTEMTPYEGYDKTLVNEEDLQKNYAYIKARMEFEDVFKDKLSPFGKESRADENRKLPIKKLLSEAKAYECMKEGKIKTAANLLSITYEVTGTDVFIDSVEEELNIPQKTVVKEKENEIEEEMDRGSM